MSNTTCFSSLDDLPVEILTRIIVILGSESAKDIISTRICLKKDEDCFCNDNFDFGMSLLGEAGDEDRLEAIYLLGMIRISRGPPKSDEGMNNMCLGILESVDVVHKLATDNITFECDREDHSVDGALYVRLDEDDNL
uniref:F-box domain-containing protein n=1 Tax=Lactuca sativa TaxID=4236 RepID=A0A9R1WRP2_LACSA|nr:hypothetical protein LSAT_V11C100042170 [Lactuca sativa]